jgi:thiol-disulfide isomerase/thioredoxin
MKLKLITTNLSFFIITSVMAQVKMDANIEAQSSADIYWNSKPSKSILDKTVVSGDQYIQLGPQALKIADFHTSEELLQYNESEIKRAIYNEMYCRMFRDWGIEFWKRFPNDPRRFYWFLETSIYQPGYFANLRDGATARVNNKRVVALDTLAKNEWESLYTQFLKEFLASTEVESYHKNTLRSELGPYLFNHFINSYRDKLNVKAYVDKVTSFANKYGPDDILGYLKIIYSDRNNFGLDDKDIEDYITLLKKTNYPEFHTVGNQIQHLVELYRTPFQLSAKSTAGKQIDLKDYKGKLVLLDLWSLGCVTCIEKMPEFKAVYQKYKDKGFEIISACFYNGKDIEGILAVHEKIGANWPLILLDRKVGKLGGKFRETYGFYTVPQLLLLDEDGKLIQYQGDMLFVKGGLEKIVKKHLENR